MRNFLRFVTLILFLTNLCSSVHSRAIDYTLKNYDNTKVVVTRTITVDKSGQGDFTSVQQAINSVPHNNNGWILINLRAGIYVEKVTIEQDQQFIALQGESARTTIITFADGGNVIDSTTFKMHADNLVARDISFVNTYNRPLADVYHERTWAPAVLVLGDKVTFRRCRFISVQDTVSDFSGRHYYHSCYIEGAVDFIWGNAQSFYKQCVLNVTTSVLGGRSSYFTAQGRESASQGTGFVFHSSSLIGTGPAYLGRAFRNFSRVLYYKTHMDNIVTPLGWDAWNSVGHEDLLTYAEVKCSGPGARKSGRVKWEKKLPYAELQKLISINYFINHDGWLRKQP